EANEFSTKHLSEGKKENKRQLEHLIKNKVKFALKFEPAKKAFYQLVFQKIKNQVNHLKSQLGTIQNQLSHQERIFARIEVRRQGRKLLTCEYKNRLGCLAVELKFQGTFNKSDYLQEFSCGICQQYITEQDICQSNYRLYVSDYANEVEKDEFFSERLGNITTQQGHANIGNVAEDNANFGYSVTTITPQPENISQQPNEPVNQDQQINLEEQGLASVEESISVLLVSIIAIKITEATERAKRKIKVNIDSITDSKKRRTFRDYFGGSLPLTRTQQKKLQNLKRGEGKLYHILKRKGINLDEEGLRNSATIAGAALSFFIPPVGIPLAIGGAATSLGTSFSQ
ncbi:6982_t:CDS:2, partial [Racocetra persica]